LVVAGLVKQTRDGREIINTVDFSAVRATLGFLTSECCTGVSIVHDTAA
jgi:hypothetical protein